MESDLMRETALMLAGFFPAGTETEAEEEEKTS